MSSPRQVTHYPLCGIFYFPCPGPGIDTIEGTNGFYCLIRKTERFTISNVESQVFTPNNSRLDPGSNPGCPCDKRMSYHWTNCACLCIHRWTTENYSARLFSYLICWFRVRVCVVVRVCVSVQGLGLARQCQQGLVS